MNLSPYLSVHIAPDRYSATVKIRAVPAVPGVVSSDVADCLRSAGVMTGFKLMEISKVLMQLQSGVIGGEYTVAEGKRKEEGRDGSEEFRFRTRLSAGLENESKVDFKERGLINNVRPGQVLAILRAEIPGKPGMCVDGSIDEPAPVKKVMMLKAGINVERFDEDGTVTYIAMDAGHARKLFDEVQVCADYIVTGDLDLSKGNIDFVRTVEILGDVKSGFKVTAGEDIVIGGDVEADAVIIAEGNICVRGTIRSGKKGTNVFCKGDLTAGSIINSRVECMGNLYLKELMLDSLVLCRGKFLSSWGVILGSTIEAIAGMVLNNVGKEDSTSENVLCSGDPYRTRLRVSHIDETLEDRRNQLELITRQVALEKSGNPDPAEEARIRAIGKARTEHARQLKEEIESLSAELATLSPKLATDSSAVIQIKGRVYPNCDIKVGEAVRTVLDAPLIAPTIRYESSESVEPPSV